MPVHTVHDVLHDPPREAEPFELAALRMTDTWIETGCVTATTDDLRLAISYLGRFGFTVELLPGCQVRVASEGGGGAVMTREEAVMTAIRHLATSGTIRSIARAA